ncbi:ureidoglycolate lyase [Gracilibacillus salinarum]|uniref:Ureidoglycolate lyase n=1 Tax=Gracilibacillus salinarum TaxID=2932255 RepID=A0ABY4GRT4_9BACI|nr:ureidoglycolate lyase [Gracilibacillus salinarum]UOQ86994.1 ureidoglycolate lyase [Gracilibacillus salinarum]
MKSVEIVPLTKKIFEPYGRSFEIPSSPPSKRGEGWDCWSYVANMNASTNVGVGIVKTLKRPLIVDEMERHVSREEILVPLYAPIIQPVGLFKDNSDPEEKPEITSVKCFLIEPGQGIILSKGIWHSPAYALEKDTDYLFFIENKKDLFGDELVNPWVKFDQNEKLEMFLKK